MNGSNCLKCGGAIFGDVEHHCPQGVTNWISGGWTCHGCSQFVPSNQLHFCQGLQWRPVAANPSRTPHRCPICDGRGSVTWDPNNPRATAGTSAGPWTCPTCLGARVLWG
jgi:hypothetical protein